MMKIFFSNTILFLKGIGMGAANVIPGVSGGTIAFITGIYERLVNCINNIDSQAVKMLFKGRFKELWKHIDGNFLLWIVAGVAVATLSLAKLMLFLLQNHPIQTWAFFFGLIIASSILMLSGLKNWKTVDAICLVCGVILGIFICTLSPVESPDNLLYIFLCGALSICAMILPGISGSFILLVMGKYEYIMSAIDGFLHFNLYSMLVLAVFLIGCICGILAFAKFLHWLLGKWNRQTLVVLSGFVLGSLVKVWPWNSYSSAPDPLTGEVPGLHIPGAVLWCLAGIILVLGLEMLGKLFKSKDSSAALKQ